MTSFLSPECDDADLQFGRERERKGHKIRLGREGDRSVHACRGRRKSELTAHSANFGLGQTRQNQEESQDSVEGNRNF